MMAHCRKIRRSLLRLSDVSKWFLMAHCWKKKSRQSLLRLSITRTVSYRRQKAAEDSDAMVSISVTTTTTTTRCFTCRWRLLVAGNVYLLLPLSWRSPRDVFSESVFSLPKQSQGCLLCGYYTWFSSGDFFIHNQKWSDSQSAPSFLFFCLGLSS